MPETLTLNMKMAVLMRHPDTIRDYTGDWALAGPLLEDLTERGYCPALVFDDNGHWAVTSDGTQNTPMSAEPEDIWTTFEVPASAWCGDPKEAIVRAYLEFWDEARDE